MTPSLRPARLLVLLLAAVGGALALSILPYQLDDAYIAYRYAIHLAAGQGPTFNIGTPPVEGFTSPVWMLLMAAAARVIGPLHLPAAATICGLASWVLVVWLGACCARGRDEGSLLITVALLCTLPGLVFYSVTGLETALFAAIVLALAGSASGELPIGWGLAAGLVAVAVRPESGYLPVMLLVQQLVSRGVWRRTLALIASVLLGGLLVLLVRLSIFALPLPHTFYAKSSDWSAGWQYVRDSLSAPPAVALLLLASLGALQAQRRHRGYLAAGLCWIPAIALEGGDWMPAGRFFVPVMVLFCVAAAGLAERTTDRRPIVRRLLAVAVLATLSLQLLAAWGLSQRTRITRDGLRREAVFVADWLERAGVESAAAVDIGWLGFASDIEIVDLGGLTDPRIGGQAGGHLEKQIDPDYVVRERRPTAIVLRIERPPARGDDGRLLYHPISGVERTILGDAGFAQSYRLAFTLLPPEPDRRPFYGKLIFVRQDVELPPSARITEPVIRLLPPASSR